MLERSDLIAAHVAEHARSRPDELAALGPSGELTWAELDAEADRVTGLLAERGVGPGDRVAWLGRNDVPFLPILVGARRRRAALVGLNWRLPAADVAGCITETTPAVVFAAADLATDPALISAAGDALITIERDGPRPWASSAPGEVLPAELDDPATFYFTSGSTGRPKAVVLDLANQEGFIAEPVPFPLAVGDRMLIVPPVFHVAGATWAQLGLRDGVAQVYIEDASPDAMLAALAKYEITHAQMVPTLMHMLMAAVHRSGTPLPALREIAYGAAPIPLPLLRDVLSTLGCRLTQVYGMSEVGGSTTCLSADEHWPGNPRLTSVGLPLADRKIRIVDPQTDEVLGVDQIGEIRIHSPWIMREYWQRPEDTAKALDADGWLRTKDVGRLDADGFLFLDGRLDDMIITGGENVHPGPVEATLCEMPGIEECAVFGVADPKWGERVWAAVVTDDAGIGEAEVIAFCRERLAHYQCPSRVIVIGELPRNASGKVVRRELVAQAEQRGTA